MTGSLSYKRNIAEGIGILIFSVLFSALIRFIYYLTFDSVQAPASDGYLWQFILPLLSDRFISFVVSCIFVAGLAFLATHINARHVFIRQRTMLPSAIVILLFSGHPSFIAMSAEYVGVLLFMYIISILFESYNGDRKQIQSFKVSLILTLGSLFVPVLLIYLPLLWIALIMVRCFNFKSFLASLLGVFIIYFPVFSFYLLTNDLNTFLFPFTSIKWEQIGDIPLFHFGISHWVILVFSLVLLTVVISDNYLNRHKDKIKVRAYCILLVSTTIFAILAFLFLNISPKINLFIALGAGSLLLSHFFALAERKESIVLFYISVVFYIFICFWPFSYL